MPQLDPNLWIEGGYYVDFDLLDQFRILGPNNHVYCGFIDIPRHRLRIDSVEATPQGTCIIKGHFQKSTINLYYPVMGDMRTMRGLVVDPKTGELITFLELRRRETSQSVPMWIHKSVGAEGKALVFRRSYGEHWYGTTFTFPKGVSVKQIQRPFGGFQLTTKARELPFTITAETNDIATKTTTCSVLPTEALEWSVFGKDAKNIKRFWQRSKIEADHLITWGKTSGDRFGTVFPRDWMESVLLGAGDIPAAVVDEMIVRCLANVDSRGRAWHEDVVGEYRYRHELAGRDLFDRKMIDIEPLTLLALRYASPYFWTRKEAVKKLRRMAGYVISRAQAKHFVAFKKRPGAKAIKDEPYYLVGNWRDSTWAFKKVHPHIAPFDVNATLYPLALKEIQLLQQKLGLRVPKLDQLVKRWSGKHQAFAFTNPDKLSAFALAVYGFSANRTTARQKIHFSQLKVNHLDECTRYALGEGAEIDLVSFAKRLADPTYFSTPSGPTLVAANNGMGYTSQEYHGLVVWTKQTAFTVMGLTRHLQLGKKLGWKPASLTLLRRTALTICQSMLHVFQTLDAVPELHYDNHGTPHFFTDQQAVGEHMSKVQLWSALGARRIFREYYKLLRKKTA
ncbi:MAG: hypothetical protein WCV85_04925 [Patescibacteria group bacterium]|jgi:hypothetical protein